MSKGVVLRNRDDLANFLNVVGIFGQRARHLTCRVPSHTDDVGHSFTLRQIVCSHNGNEIRCSARAGVFRDGQARVGQHAAHQEVHISLLNQST